MSATASDVATTALSGGRVQLAINVGSAVAEAVTKYVMSLLGPDKRLELGAWIAVTINALDNNFINPPKPDPKVAAVVKRQGPAYAYVATLASILNPFWIYGSYSLLAQQIIKRLKVPKQKTLCSRASWSVSKTRQRR